MPLGPVEHRYVEAERTAEAKRLARARRQPLILIALVNVLVVAIAATAVVDLRRLQAPEGTALRWAQAAVFGDCGDYLTYSVADPSATDARSADQLCRDLRAATAMARDESLKIGLAVRRVVIGGSRAEVELVLTRKGVATDVSLRVARTAGGWRVLRDGLTCGSIGCA
jgi:uncharacterized protein YcfJ